MHAPAVLVLVISTIFITEANDLQPSQLSEKPQDIIRVLFEEQGQGKTTFVISQPILAWAMTLLALGSGGETREQIVKGLNFYSEDAHLSRNTSTVLMHAFRSSDKYWRDLETSVALYVRNDTTLQSQFKDLSTKGFDAFVSGVNFQNDLKNTEKFINNNMYETTNHKVMDILATDIVAKDSQLVLVSGVYFKGHWKYQFIPAGNKTFQASSTLTMPMMRVQGQFEVADLPGGVRALRIPFANETFGLWVFLPSNSSSYEMLRKEFSNNTWTQAELKKNLSNVEVLLPRFHIDFSSVYNSALKKLGIVEAFSKSANFSAITNMGSELKLSSVVQKLVLETSEEGENSISDKPSGDAQQFWVNQSFVFAIVGDKTYDWPLFFGSYSGEEDRAAYPSDISNSQGKGNNGHISRTSLSVSLLALVVVLVTTQ